MMGGENRYVKGPLFSKAFNRDVEAEENAAFDYGMNIKIFCEIVIFSPSKHEVVV